MDTVTPCLCGSGLAYSQCCGAFHSGEKIPATAEALMRSRYSAYALRDSEYLQATWVLNKRPKSIDFSKENVLWQRLEIIATKQGGLKDSKGVVEFKAYFEQAGEEHVLHEISRFTKLNGRWFYSDGTLKGIAKVGQPVLHGQNAPCACGSGKKFKRCCGKDVSAGS